MRAVRVTQTGGPEVLVVEDLPVPEPGPGQIRIRVAAVGVNFLDVYQRSGMNPVALPFVPGNEAAGVVDAVGEGVTAVAEGDRVAHGNVTGSYTEYQLAPADRVVGVPEGVDLETAAAVMLQGMTAHYLTTSTRELRPGDRVLVHAGAGGAGLLITQMAVRRGATVYTTVSTEEKAELSRAAGATEVIRYDQTDFADEVARLTDGAGVQAVYDGVGQATFDGSLASLAPRGTLAAFGWASGVPDPVDLRRLAPQSLFLTRPGLLHHIATREDLEWRGGEILAAVSDGGLDVHIGETHPLDEAAEAHRRLEGRQTTGKVLLVP